MFDLDFHFCFAEMLTRPPCAVFPVVSETFKCSAVQNSIRK